jgi:HK97 family phage portal protein
MGLGNWIRTKLNPAQEIIAQGEGTNVNTDSSITYLQAFDRIDSVNRGVNLIVNAAAGLDYDVKSKILSESAVGGMKQKKLLELLNYRPNLYQSAQEFRKNIFTDYLLEGNVFIYFDGAFMYHLPANKVTILTDTKTFVKGYEYNGVTQFKPNEVFHFKDLSSDSIYRGTSRLQSAQRSIDLLGKMNDFQQRFFDNGAIFGMVLTTDNTLGNQAKERTINYWVQRYNTKNGGKRPVILDSGLKPQKLTDTNFKEMDFDTSVKTHSDKILQALGVPPILLHGGNNANIAPNLRLFYLETVLPIARGFVSALERQFGYDVEVITSTVSALQPELKDIASYNVSLVNGGIITPNEARVELRYEKLAGGDEIRIPANVAGSAADPSQGGRPSDSNQ